MRTGSKGIALIKDFESLQLKAYRCPAGVLTIGCGHTANVKEGDVCTESEAEEMLKQDLAKAESAVNALGVEFTQNQFDALVSFCFNVGVEAFNHSTLRRKLLVSRADETLRHEFLRWKYVKGHVVRGLLRRREAEADLYFE